MKKILLTLLALTFSTACKAEDSKQVSELKKRCEELTKETGEEYKLVSGVQVFNDVAYPIPCGANFIDGKIIPNQCEQLFKYQIQLEDKSKHLNKILFDTDNIIKEEEVDKFFTKGQHYAICAKSKGYEDYLTGVLETLTAIE